MVDRRNARTKTCECGRMAIKHSRGGFVCARCHEIEESLSADFVKIGINNARPFSKYFAPFSATLPNGRQL